MEDAYIYLLVVSIALFFSVFNIFTLLVIFLNKKLRNRTSNFPIVSFLFASAFQGLIPAPVYVYRQLVDDDYTQIWTCNVYRFPYILCGHLMKISLMLVSFDRVAAVKYPFKYKQRNVPRFMILALVLVWLVTGTVDTIPFINGISANSACMYIPTKYWGLTVLLLYDLLAFVIIVVNYSIVWSLAAKFAFQDKNRKESLQSQEYLNVGDDVVYAENEPLLSQRARSYGSLKNGQASHHGNKTISNIRHLLDIRATKTSLVLVAVYLFCWGPLGLFYTMDHFCDGCLSSKSSTATARIIIKTLNFSSSVLAPLVYCWWNKEYRKTAKVVARKFFCCCCASRFSNGQKNSLQCKSLETTRYPSKKSPPQLPKIEETKLSE